MDTNLCDAGHSRDGPEGLTAAAAAKIVTKQYNIFKLKQLMNSSELWKKKSCSKKYSI